MSLTTDNILISAYRKVRAIAQITSTNSLKKALTDVIVNGNAIARVENDLFIENTPNDYWTEIDVQNVIQNFLNPGTNNSIASSSFNNINSPFVVSSTDLFCEVVLVTKYLYEDPLTGKLVDEGVIDTSNPIYAFTATTQHTEPIDFAEFIPSIMLVPARFLTNYPIDVEVCTNESSYLSFLSSLAPFAINQIIRIRSFNSSGVLIQEGLIDVSSLLPPQPQTGVISFGIGYSNFPDSSLFTSGVVDITLPTVDFYLVDLGYLSPSFTSGSEERRFKIKRKCCDKYKLRIHYMNNKSGFDSITVTYETSTQSTKYDVIQKALPFGSGPVKLTPPLHSSLFKGKFPVNITSSAVYSCQYMPKSNQEREAIRDLFYSPEVYCTFDNEIVQPCLIQAEDIELLSREDLQPIEFNLVLSNDALTMKN